MAEKKWPPPGYPVVEGDYALDATWSMYLPERFACRVQDGALVLWRPGLTIWLTAWNNDNAQSQAERLVRIKRTASPNRFAEQENNAGNVTRFSYRLRDENENGPVESMYAFVINDGGHLQLSIYFDDPKEETMARKLAESVVPRAAPRTEGEFWDKLTEIGWLDAVPQAERTRLRRAVAEWFARDPTEAFYSLAVTSFDLLCIEGEGPGGSTYYTVLSQLAEASHGKFAPTDLTDELLDDEDLARVSFRHGGKLFSCEVPWEDDCFQRAVLDLVNKALRASKAEEQFIPLQPRGQTIFLVLVPPALYERAVHAGLIPG